MEHRIQSSSNIDSATGAASSNIIIAQNIKYMYFSVYECPNKCGGTCQIVKSCPTGTERVNCGCPLKSQQCCAPIKSKIILFILIVLIPIYTANFYFLNTSKQN